MADILTYNAINKVNKTLQINNGLGIPEADIKTAVDAAIDGTSGSAVFDKQYCLERLSCNQQIAHCCCNYAGSGTNGVVGGSLWGEMTPFTGTGNSIYTKLIELPEMAYISSIIDALESTQLKNNIKQYIELYAKEVIDGLTQTAKDYWFSTPESVKVCSSNFRCGEGATCTWIVPTGTSKAKFQLWGAGAGSGVGCCCGGAPFGANGAYSELTINVTPGDSYLVCAGCSCQHMCCSGNQTVGCACMTGVTGNGICCLKANGGRTCHGHSLMYARGCLACTSTCCRYQNFYCTASGPCFCNNGQDYCFASSCATCGVVPVYADCCQISWCACGTDTAEINKDGYRNLLGGGCFDTNHYGYMIKPPILDSDSCSRSTISCQCATFTSEACKGGCLNQSWPRHPGEGASYGHVMGGANSHKYGTGTAGMVKITWE